MAYDRNRHERGSFESQGITPCMNFAELIATIGTRPSTVPRHEHLTRAQNLAIHQNYKFLKETIREGVLVEDKKLGVHGARAYVSARNGLVLAVDNFFSNHEATDGEVEQSVVMDFQVAIAPDGTTHDFDLQPTYDDATQLSLGGLEVVRLSLLRCNGTIE